MQSYALGVVNAIDQKLKEFVQSKDRMQKYEDYKKATGKDLMVISVGALLDHPEIITPPTKQ